MSKHKSQARIDPLSMALPAGGLESHAHLDNKAFDPDRDVVIERALACGLSHIINVFLSPDEYTQGQQLLAAHPEILCLLGIHPSDAQDWTEYSRDFMLQAFTTNPRLRALGEIGLDYYWDDCPRDVQQRVFRQQIALARQCDVPIVIHCRDAAEDTLAILEDEKMSGYPLLWHCFGADSALAQRIIAHNWHISVPGPVTFPANAPLREALAAIPANRLLLETDCPYLSPVPWRGTRNEPAYTVFTAHAIAQALQRPVDELWQQCGENGRSFFGI